MANKSNVLRMKYTKCNITLPPEKGKPPQTALLMVDQNGDLYVPRDNGAVRTYQLLREILGDGGSAHIKAGVPNR